MSVLPYSSRVLKICFSKIVLSSENSRLSVMCQNFSTFHTQQRLFSQGSGSCTQEPSCMHQSLSPPDGMTDSIFRKFTEPNEKLGPGADKCGEYKNPEYYGYHKYTFSEALVQILEIRQKQADKQKKVDTCEPVKCEPVKADAEPKKCSEIAGESKPKEDDTGVKECGKKPEESKPKEADAGVTECGKKPEESKPKEADAGVTECGKKPEESKPKEDDTGVKECGKKKKENKLKKGKKLKKTKKKKGKCKKNKK